MRRIAILCALVTAFVFMLLLGCRPDEVAAPDNEGIRRTFAQLYSLEFPASYSQYASRGVFAASETENGQEQDGTPYIHKLYADFMPYESLELIQELELMGEEMDEQVYNEQLTDVYDSLRVVFVVTLYQKQQIAEGADLSAITGFESNTLLAEWGEYVCYASTPAWDESGMQGQSLNAYRELYDGMQKVFDSLQPVQ